MVPAGLRVVADAERVEVAGQRVRRQLPDLSEATARLQPIPGLMPDPTALPEGCYFSPRCPRAMEVCSSRHPADIDVEGRRVKCHLYDASAAGDADGEAASGRGAADGARRKA